MKKLIIKYSIEFFVIVFSISVSFFVENLREEYEKDNQRIIVKQMNKSGEISPIKMLNPNFKKNKSYYLNFKLVI